MPVSLPARELLAYSGAELRHDLLAAATVTFLSVPQCIAYALVAGLPPAMGLYAAALPAVVGSLFRSSRHVVTGPSNAVSLLVGSVILASGAPDPVAAAITLACLVGGLQLVSGLLGLGALVDFISRPVVVGYITGAAGLLVVGQLPNLTASAAPGATVGARLVGWLQHLDETSALAAGVGAGTAGLVVALQRIDRRIPAPMLAMIAGIALSHALELGARGVPIVAHVAAVPTGLPPLTLPDASLVNLLLPGALACALLSLVESSSVARTLASQSGQRLSLDTEFVGQGLANLAAGLGGGYPTSGSLGRSALNAQAGARGRLSGTLSGLFMLLVVAGLGPLFDATPIPCLAGLIVVIAIELVDVAAIRRTLDSGRVDGAALVGTMVGTWLLPLDVAILLGVAISLVLFLRRARLLSVHEMGLDHEGQLRERSDDADDETRTCGSIRILQVDGSFFFASVGQFRDALAPYVTDPQARVLLLRMKRARLADVTSAEALAELAERLHRDGRHLVLAGLRPQLVALLGRTDLAARIGPDNLFPREPGWFAAMQRAMGRAGELAGEHACGEACPVLAYARRASPDYS